MTDVKNIESFDFLRVLNKKEKQEVLKRLYKLEFNADDQICYRGDMCTSMYMITEGQVDELHTSEGLEYVISSWKEGDFFGEISLLTGEPLAADIRASTSATLYQLKKTDFDELIENFPYIRNKILILLGKRLKKTIISEHIQQSRSDAAIIDLLSHTRPPEIDHYPGKSKWSEYLNRDILALSCNEKNVLITGEPGTEKNLVAELIYFVRQGKKGPLILLNCADPPPFRKNRDYESDDSINRVPLGEAQEIALFGIQTVKTVSNQVLRKGYLEIASGGILVLENVDKLLPGVQKLLIEYLTKSMKGKKNSKSAKTRNLRIIAIASSEFENRKKNDEFSIELFDILRQDYIDIIPLSKRKKDIPVIAELLLKRQMEIEGKDIRGFTPEAVSILVNHDWPLNYDQLKQVVNRAVALCSSTEVNDEHIILDITSFSTEGKVNVLNYPFFKNLVQKSYFPTIIKNISIPIFIVLIAHMLLGPEIRNLSNLIIWTIWWPALLLLNAIAHRSWCSVCPLPDMGKGINFLGLNLFDTPAFLKNYRSILGITGFFLIVYIEYRFHMFTNPRATGYLLLVLVAGIVLMGLLYGKRSWCKYLCPLGRMLSFFSPISLLELSSNKNICVNQCTTYDCIKDDNCPMGIHPSTTNNRFDCVFCLSCIKKCPYKAIHIIGRVPWRGVIEQKNWHILGGLFAILTTASVLAVNIPKLVSDDKYFLFVMPQYIKSSILQHQDLAFIFILAGYTLLVTLSSYFSSSRSFKNIFSVVGYAYLPLAFFGLFSIYFREFVLTGSSILPEIIDFAGLKEIIPDQMVYINLETLNLLFPVFALASLWISLFLLKKISNKMEIQYSLYLVNKIFLIITALIFLFVL